MSDQDRIHQAARFLFEEHQARTRYRPIPEPCAPHTIDEAYAMQEAFQKLLTEVHGPIGGRKIALTSAVMQQMVGVNEPIGAFILANTIHQSPVTLHGADFAHLGVECEVAVRMGADLPAARAPYSRDSVADAVTAVMAAFELIDDRNADYSKLPAQMPSLVADNWNAGIVLGPAVTDWRTIDLAAARATMVINGAVVGEGHGSDVMGHPLEALVWLANMLATRGTSLSQGMIVMTGSIVATKFVNPGDVVTLSVHGLGEVRLSVS